MCAVDFDELLNQSSGDLSIAHGLNLTDLYSIATQDQSVFLQEYVPHRFISRISLLDHSCQLILCVYAPSLWDDDDDDDTTLP